MNACGEDEYPDTGVCKKCTGTGDMVYCYSCTAAAVCTKCISGYLKSDSTGCIAACLAGTCENSLDCIDVAGLKCVAACPTSPDKTYPSKNKAKPVNIIFNLFHKVMYQKL